MTTKRILDAAQILGELGNGKMANELTRLSDRYRWRPIAEIHEDFGECVLMNIEDPGNMALGNNLTPDYDETLWTHFTQITPLSHEEAAEMKYFLSQGRGLATAGNKEKDGAEVGSGSV